MKNVAYILKDLVVGGIQTLLIDLVDEFKKNRQKVVLIAIGDGELFETFKSLGVPFYYFPKKIPLFDPFTIFRIRQVLIREKIDIVHGHHTSEGIAAYFSSIGLKTKTVLTYHVGAKMNNRQDDWAFKKLASRMGKCISPTLSHLKELESHNYNTGNFEVVHNGISIQRLRQKNNARDIREELNLGPGHFLIGMVGNFYNDTRNQLLVCKAFEIVAHQNKNARLVFFGGHSNKYLPEAKNYRTCLDFCAKHGLAGKVFFPGLELDIGAAYKAMDLFVYASNNDTFGMAVVEALLCKKPVIVNNLDVFSEVAQNGKLADLYPTGDYVALANLILEKMEPSNNKKSDEIYEDAMAFYAIENHYKNLNKVYGRLFGQ